MGSIIRFPRCRHTRASSEAGRGTCEGHGESSGHRSENQLITSSYLRAVKVLPSSSKRSKKRQSPAAKRPKVDKLMDRAAAYADAQASKLDRSSVSMGRNNSREIPTSQELLVGNFRLAQAAEKSDKSAMPTVNEVRARIALAIERSGDQPVTLALDWGVGRDHIRDFLTGRKDSLKLDVLEAISERYDIPLTQLIIRRARRKRQAA